MNYLIYAFYSVFAIGSSSFLSWAELQNWLLPSAFLFVLILGLASLSIYYYGIDSFKMGEKKIYRLILGLNVVLVFLVTFLMAVFLPRTDEDAVSVFDIILFAVENAIFAFIYCYVISLFLKQKSAHCKHVPNLFPHRKQKK